MNPGFFQFGFQFGFQFVIVAVGCGANLRAEIAAQRAPRHHIAVAQCQAFFTLAQSQRTGGVGDIEHSTEFPAFCALAGFGEVQVHGRPGLLHDRLVPGAADEHNFVDAVAVGFLPSCVNVRSLRGALGGPAFSWRRSLH